MSTEIFESVVSSSIAQLQTVKTNYFTVNQEDLTINGGNVPNIMLPAFCNGAQDVIDIYVQATALDVDGMVISILEGDEVVAIAKADDLEEPSSLFVLYRGNKETDY